VPECIPRAIAWITFFVVSVGEKYTSFSEGISMRCPPSLEAAGFFTGFPCNATTDGFLSFIPL
jgi:hypothetical protein